MYDITNTPRRPRGRTLLSAPPSLTTVTTGGSSPLLPITPSPLLTAPTLLPSTRPRTPELSTGHSLELPCTPRSPPKTPELRSATTPLRSKSDPTPLSPSAYMANVLEQLDNVRLSPTPATLRVPAAQPVRISVNSSTTARTSAARAHNTRARVPVTLPEDPLPAGTPPKPVFPSIPYCNLGHKSTVDSEGMEAVYRILQFCPVELEEFKQELQDRQRKKRQAARLHLERPRNAGKQPSSYPAKNGSSFLAHGAGQVHLSPFGHVVGEPKQKRRRHRRRAYKAAKIEHGSDISTSTSVSAGPAASSSPTVPAMPSGAACTKPFIDFSALPEGLFPRGGPNRGLGIYIPGFEDGMEHMTQRGPSGPLRYGKRKRAAEDVCVELIDKEDESESEEEWLWS